MKNCKECNKQFVGSRSSQRWCSRDCFQSKRTIHAGQKFNYLTALRKVSKMKWLWKCKCGREKEIDYGHVKYGKTQSCGCYLNEIITTHGLANTRIYTIWENMKQRCLNKKNDSYFKYGERGIKICERWHLFKNFYEDMGESYTKHVSEYGEKNTSIDRINNDGNYELLNCRWATPKEQSNNQRPNKTQRNFKAIDPSGNVYYSNNQSAFAREHGMTQSGLGMSLRKKRKYKKWVVTLV